MTDKASQIQDEYLVLKCQEGDSGAFDVLVRRWHKRLWLHAFRLTGDRDAASDVVQETWSGVIRGLGGLRLPSLFPGWVYRIATNKARDWIRRQARRREMAEALTEREEPASSSRVVSAAAISLEQALLELPGESRALLDLYYVQGFDVREVAEILSVPPGTVKSRLARAREALRRRMEELNDAER